MKNKITIIVYAIIAILFYSCGSSDSKYFPEHFDKLELDMTLEDMYKVFPGGSTYKNQYEVNIPNVGGFTFLRANFDRSDSEKDGLLSMLYLKGRGEEHFEKLVLYTKRNLGDLSSENDRRGEKSAYWNDIVDGKRKMSIRINGSSRWSQITWKLEIEHY